LRGPLRAAKCSEKKNAARVENENIKMFYEYIRRRTRRSTTKVYI